MIYRLLVKIDRKLTKTKKLNRPVISIGNITWGGTGKTPVVIKLAKELIEKGLKPAVLTRGYFKKYKSEPGLIVSDGINILVQPDVSGDEPFLLAENIPKAIVAVGVNRVLSAKVVSKNFSPDIFILDDGFQHWKIKRDLDIVCINALNPFGNGFLIPAGSLREAISSVKRADLVILTNSGILDKEIIKKIEAKLSKYCVSIVKAQYRPSYFRSIIDGNIFTYESFKGKNIIAFSALGENKGFFSLLSTCGINIVKEFCFRDHHWYENSEINKIISYSKDMPIVTTAKDAVKIKKILKELPVKEAKKFFCLDVEMEFLEGKEFWENQIQKILQFF